MLRGKRCQTGTEREGAAMKILKFGGTSLEDPERIRASMAIIQATAARGPVVVVVSAMGGVTDALLEVSRRSIRLDVSAAEICRQLEQRHQEAIREVAAPAEVEGLLATVVSRIRELGGLLKGVSLVKECSPRTRDEILSFGERLSACVVAAALRCGGIPAEECDARGLLVTQARFGAAHVDEETTFRRVRDHFAEHEAVQVVTGFIAAGRDGRTTTLGRGGSDLTASILGAALGAEAIEIWTDVRGVMSADPKIVADAHTIPTLTAREVGELAYFGAKVLHPKTIQPVVQARILLRIKNTFNPDHPGTLVVNQNGGEGDGIKAVTIVRDLALIAVEGTGMLGVPGIAARTFAAVAATQTNILMISQSSSEQSICFIVPGGQAGQVVEALKATFALELERRDIDRIWAQPEVDIVTVVGSRMRDTPGIAGQIFTATGQHGVNVIAIAQGSSECSISLVVDARDGDAAVRCIHALAVAPAPA